MGGRNPRPGNRADRDPVGAAGHLVFTTVHANNVTDVIGRFINMGVEPYNFVSALNCIMAQRLVRLICNIASGRRSTLRKSCWNRESIPRRRLILFLRKAWGAWNVREPDITGARLSANCWT